MLAILKKELKIYFTSLSTYIYYVLFFLTAGILFCSYCLSNYNTQFGYYVISKVFYICVLIIPFFTMRMFAQEKKLRTDQLLFTSPVSDGEIMWGKYIAAIITLALPVLVSVCYPVVLSNYGDISIRFIVCSYIAVFLGIIVLTAIGMFFSTITNSIVLAAAFTYGIYIVFFLMRIVESILGQDGLYRFVHKVSIYTIYNDMVSGIVRSGDILFLICICILFVFLTWLNLRKKWIGALKYNIRVGVGVISFLVLSFVCILTTKVYDFTPEGILTISDDTKEILRDVNEETTIYYMGNISNANATYYEFLDLYQKENDKIKVIYKDYSDDPAFIKQYLSDIGNIHEASMLVVCGDSYIYLDSNDYISTIKESEYSYKSILEIEEQLTKAIHYTNIEDSHKLCYLQGHDETVITGGFKNKILLNGYELEGLYLNDGIHSINSVIPDNCEAVIINSPQSDYSDEEIDALDQYLSNGGKIIAFIDSLNEDIPKLYDFFKEHKMEIASGVVVEQDPSRYAYDTNYYLAPKLTDHEINKELIDNRLYVYTMTSKGIIKNDDPLRTDLLVTSAKAYSKVSDFDNLDTKAEDDISGPFSIAGLYEDNGSKLFLMTSNMLINDDVDRDCLGGNHRFLVSVLNYVTDNSDAITLTGKNVNYKTALYPNTSMKFVKVLTIFIIPFAIVIIGVIIIVIRKKNIIISLRSKKENNTDDKESE